MEYFIVSRNHQELYEQIKKIVVDWNMTHKVKVVKSTHDALAEKK